jgi:hypothetical protein
MNNHIPFGTQVMSVVVTGTDGDIIRIFQVKFVEYPRKGPRKGYMLTRWI